MLEPLRVLLLDLGNRVVPCPGDDVGQTPFLWGEFEPEDILGRNNIVHHLGRGDPCRLEHEHHHRPRRRPVNVIPPPLLAEHLDHALFGTVIDGLGFVPLPVLDPDVDAVLAERRDRNDEPFATHVTRVHEIPGTERRKPGDDQLSVNVLRGLSI